MYCDLPTIFIRLRHRCLLCLCIIVCACVFALLSVHVQVMAAVADEFHVLFSLSRRTKRKGGKRGGGNASWNNNAVVDCALFYAGWVGGRSE